MSEMICGNCGLPIHPTEVQRYFGDFVAHREYRCIELLKAQAAERDAWVSAAERAEADLKRERAAHAAQLVALREAVRGTLAHFDGGDHGMCMTCRSGYRYYPRPDEVGPCSNQDCPTHKWYAALASTDDAEGRGP